MKAFGAVGRTGWERIGVSVHACVEHTTMGSSSTGVFGKEALASTGSYGEVLNDYIEMFMI